MKTWVQAPIHSTNTFIDDKDLTIIPLEQTVLLDAPVINQLPELPRGCEVTSLAMLLQYANISVDKMTLAKEIKKDTTAYKVSGGKVHYGHPNDGFVGSMYSKELPGLGVYHEPIKELAEKYLPGQIEDLTGSSFNDLKIHLSDKRPVWVITNTSFKKLSSNQFVTWHTPNGVIDITYKEHSVLLTGFDKDYVYFNDPLTGEKNKKAPIMDFEESWVQMGSQAITYLPL
nr:C39 family peptidase [Robertmurraya korlensis]